jgi:hypothetical protein
MLRPEAVRTIGLEGIDRGEIVESAAVAGEQGLRGRGMCKGTKVSLVGGELCFGADDTGELRASSAKSSPSTIS